MLMVGTPSRQGAGGRLTNALVAVEWRLYRELAQISAYEAENHSSRDMPESLKILARRSAPISWPW